MNNFENNLVSKLLRQEKFIDDKATILANFPALTLTGNKFKAKMLIINESTGKLVLDITGIAKQKQIYREQYEKDLLFICRPSSVYFYHKNDLKTFEELNFRISHFTRMHENDLLSVGTEIYKIINPEITPLEDYGLYPLDIQAMQVAQTNFAEYISAPHTAISEHHTLLNFFKKVLRDTNTISKIELDGMMLILSRDYMHEYKEWLSISKIIDLGHSEKEGVEFTFEDKISKDRLKDVTIDMPNDFVDNIHNSDNKGVCYVHIPGQDDEYTFTATLPNYKPYTGTVKVDENHLTQVTVFMEKL